MKEYKYQMLNRRTKEIIAEYDMRLTIRQIFYRLVSAQDIMSNRSEYVYFDKVFTEYRQQNISIAQYIEDKTRKIIENIYEDYPLDSYSESINNTLENVKTGYPYQSYNKNLLQSKITVILVEKQALENIFVRAIVGYPNTLLVVCRGFNSFTQMYELREMVKDTDKELNLYIFTDYDDSGLLIQDNFIKQMREYLTIEFDNIKRIALTDEQINKYNLPQNPTKKSTHSKYNLSYFVELDALDPNILTDLIKDCCKENYDENLYNAIDKALTIRNRRLKKAYFRELKKIDLSKI